MDRSCALWRNFAEPSVVTETEKQRPEPLLAGPLTFGDLLRLT